MDFPIGAVFSTCNKEKSNNLDMKTTDMKGIINAYNILNLAIGSTREKVENRYYELLKKYHPDKAKNRNNPDSKSKYDKIKSAYSLIIDYIEGSTYIVNDYNSLVNNTVDRDSEYKVASRDQVRTFKDQMREKDEKNREILQNLKKENRKYETLMAERSNLDNIERLVDENQAKSISNDRFNKLYEHFKDRSDSEQSVVEYEQLQPATMYTCHMSTSLAPVSSDNVTDTLLDGGALDRFYGNSNNVNTESLNSNQLENIYSKPMQSTDNGQLSQGEMKQRMNKLMNVRNNIQFNKQPQSTLNQNNQNDNSLDDFLTEEDDELLNELRQL